MEVWVYVFKFLEAESLLRCQGVCAAWRTEILHMVHTGKIPRLGLCCERLVWSEDVLSEYKKSTWESLSLCVDKPVLLVGVGVYTPSGETTICVDARPLLATDQLRPIDVATQLDSIHEQDGKVITLFGKENSKPFRFRLEAGEWWEIVLNIRPEATGPAQGRTVWCVGGKGGREQVFVHGVNFSFRRTVRDGWRSDYSEGQFPLLYFWRI